VRPHLATEHPAPDRVAAFGLGSLPEAESAAVEEHLAWCEACVRLLDAQPDDSFLAALRGAARPSSTASPDAPTAGAPAPATTRDGDSRPTADATAGNVPAEFVGHPRYRVLDLLGRGGMGEVYRAHEPSIGRDLAVKVLHARYRTDPNAARRFEAEARVTGRLQHPGVPPVFQVGTLADGSPFLAMKLIQGRTLAAVLAAPDRPDPAALLAVFEHVCQAVGYAHSKGVIHRDLKPGNVMVGAFGEVQVMDWGLAKLVGGGERPADESVAEEGPPDLTRDGAVMGTPAYMAPEQARGEADLVGPRSDVFGLGAILCEILTGEPPFGGPDAVTTLRQAASGDVAAALARLDRCGADPAVAELCRLCLAPDPAERPADGGEVARAVADLRADADERARRAELERVKTLVEAAARRKRRRVLAALGVALGLLVAGGVAVAWREDLAAQKRIAEEVRLGDEATRRADLNAEALDASLAECEAGLGGGVADPDRAAAALAQAERRAADPGGDRQADRLARCRRELATLRELIALDQDIWNDRASGQMTPLEIVLRLRGILDRFGVSVGKTVPAEAAALLSGSAIQPRLVRALDVWLTSEAGETQRTPGVRAILRAVDPDPFRDDVRDLAANWKRWDEIAVAALAARPDAERQPGRFTSVFCQSRAIPADRRRQLLCLALAREPGDLILLMTIGDTYPFDDTATASQRARWYQAAVAVAPWNAAAHHNLGTALYHLGDLPGAEVCMREATRLSPANANALSSLGVVLQARGKLDESVATHERALELKPGDGRLHSNHGSTLQARSDWAGAAAAYRKAIELDPSQHEVRSGLGVVLVQSGSVDEGVAVLRSLVVNSPNSSHAHHDLGVALLARGDLPGAIAEHREAIRLDPKNGNAYVALGTALIRVNDLPGAVAALREAVRLRPTDLQALNGLGAALIATGDPGGAMAQFQEAVRLNPEDAASLTNLGETVRAKRDLTRALDLQKAAVRIDPKEPRIRAHLANVLFDLKRLTEAAEECREAIRLDPKPAAVHFNLSRILLAQGDARGSIAALRAAVTADPRHLGSWYALGVELSHAGDHAGAQPAFRAAAALDPKNAEILTMLGYTLLATRELGAGVANLRDAMRLDPTRPGPHFFLGNALFMLGDLDGAERSFREVIRLDPAPAGAHYALATILGEKGDFGSAVTECEKALRLEPGLAGARQALPWLKHSRDLLARLPEVAAGHAALTPAEAAELAELCRRPGVRRYAPAVWLYQERPGPVVVPAAATGARSWYNPACAAALVAAGKDADLTRVGVEEWGYYTGQAHGWLKKDLATLAAQAKAPATRDAVRRMLEHWKKDRDLAAVRDPEWLAAMPVSDRKRWEALWAEVDALLASTR
jgi:Flp pilus assembly protein TadD